MIYRLKKSNSFRMSSLTLMSSFTIYFSATSNKQNLLFLLLKYILSQKIKLSSASQMSCAGRKHLPNRKKKVNKKKLMKILQNNLTLSNRELLNLLKMKKRKHMFDLQIKTMLFASPLPNTRKLNRYKLFASLQGMLNQI